MQPQAAFVTQDRTGQDKLSRPTFDDEDEDIYVFLHGREIESEFPSHLVLPLWVGQKFVIFVSFASAESDACQTQYNILSNKEGVTVLSKSKSINI